MSNATIKTDSTNASAVQGAVVDNRSTVHEAAVAEIVGMIRAKFEDEGERNFAIGKRAFEHAQWQKGNFPQYTGGDFDTLMRRLRDDVRLYVPIKADSIRVDDWARCHVLRDEVAKAIGLDAARLLSFFEYRTLIGKALAFSKKDVEGSLVAGWLDMIKGIAHERSNGGRVNSETFLARVADTAKALEAAKTAADPAAAAAKLASDAIKAKTKAVAKANEDITSSVSDALANGHVSAEGVLGIVENVAKHHGIPLPTSIGFDPAKCTVADCDLLASTMFQAGKYAEMVHLRDRLDKMVAAVDKARASAKQPAAAKIGA